MDMLFENYSEDTVLSEDEIDKFIKGIISYLNITGKALIVPPDISRLSSKTGRIAESIYSQIPDNIKMIIPALGTHNPMTAEEINRMFGKIPADLFRNHNWKGNLETAGTIPASFIREKTGIKGINVAVKVNRELFKKNLQWIISIGQVVPHEVTGMSNHNKNILVGMGGADIINASHYISALYGMEKIMGRAANPIREILDFAEKEFLSDIPLFYILTVSGTDKKGKYGIKGIFAGDSSECYKKASEASFNENITILGSRIDKILISLPDNIKSLWIGNKAIYRSRMALKDNGELFISGKGIKGAGEDNTLDALIRKYGYRGTSKTIEAVKHNRDLKENLSAAAHLIHGSSEGRFRITWKDTKLSPDEIRSLGFNYIEKGSMFDKIDFSKLKPGYNNMGNNDFYYIPDPGQGLWSAAENFIKPE